MSLAKNLPYYLVLFFAYCGFAQKAIVVDTTFTQLKLKESLVYYHDVEQLENSTTIANKQFTPFNKSFPGLRKAKFWFHFNVKNDFDIAKQIVLKVKIHTVSNLKLYQIIDAIPKKCYEFSNSNKKKIDIPLLLKANANHSFYIEVSFTRSVFFPSTIATVQQNDILNHNLLISDALFYGFSIVVLIINLLFYVNTRNNFFIYYCLLLIAIMLSFMNAQGMLFHIFGGYGAEFKIYTVLFLNLFTMLVYILFTANALELRKYYPKHVFIGGILLVSFLLFSVFYLLTNNIFWYAAIKAVYLTTTIVYWWYGILLFKRLVYARFLTIAYTVLFLSQTAYMLSINFGYTQIGFTEQFYKIGCVIEMLVFLYAISYRHKKVERERQHIQHKLEEKLKATHTIALENDSIKEKIETHKAQIISEDDVYASFVKKYTLTNRELEICKYIIKGASNEEIAQEAAIKMTTVKYHVSNIFKKLNVKNRTEILALYISFKENM